MLGISQIEVWRTWCQWVNWPREITALRGFNQCRLPCICTCTPTQQAYSLTTSHLHRSQMYVLAYYEFPYGVKKDGMAWTCHFSLKSRTKVSGGGVWDPDQLVQSAGDPVYLFHTCAHANTACIWQTAAVLQVGCEKWLPTTAVQQIPPPPFQIWHLIQPDPTHNTHKCECPDGLSVGLSYKSPGISELCRTRQPKGLLQLVVWVNMISCQLWHCKFYLQTSH